MKNALILQTLAFEDPDTLTPLLEAAGYIIETVLLPTQPPDAAQILNCDLLVLMGGPVSVNDEADFPFIAPLCDMLAKRIAAGRPTLGICLGAQFIAKSLGATVQPMASNEIGWSPLILTDSGQQSCLRHLEDVQVLHWHGEYFTIPAAADLLASTAACQNQAFRVAEHTPALQFHLEVSARGVERWYVGHTLELAHAKINIPALRQAGQTHAPLLAAAAAKCINSWLHQL